MAKYSIYSAAGVLKAEGCPTYTGTYMKPGVIDFRSIGSPSLIEWAVGDYVDYDRTGLRYRVYRVPATKRQAYRRKYGAALEYQNVQLYDDSYQLQICPFRDLVPGDSRTHFSTQPMISVFDDVAGIAERVQACLEDMYGAGSWVVRTVGKAEYKAVLLARGVDATTAEEQAEVWNTFISEEKEFAVSNVNLLQVLDKVYELWPEVGWIYKVEEGVNTIVIGGGGLNSQVDVYAYGKGHGLLSLQRTVANADELANRLYVYGSDKNMLPRWYNQFNIKDADSVDIQHLMLPISTWGTTEVGSEDLPDPAKAFIDADGVDTSNLRPRVVYFDGSGDVGDIYPTIKNLTAGEARAAIPSGTQYRPSTTIYADSDPLDEVLAAQNPSDNGLAGNAYGKGAAQSETLDFSGANGGTIGADEEIAETIFNGSVIAQSDGKYNITVILTPIAPSSVSGDITGVRLELNVMGQVWQLSLEGSGGGAWYPAPVTAKLNGITLPVSGAIDITATLYLDNKGNDEDETVSWSLAGTIAVSLAKTRETTFYVTIPQIGFDIEEQAALGDGKTIAFTSGMCAGRTFPIKSAAYLAATDSWRLEVIRTEDESLAQYFPNTNFPIAAGNKFVLLDIAMPPYLINVAEGRLLAAAQELLAYTSKEIWQYVPEMDAKYMEEHGKVILPAEYIALTDDELFALQTLSYFKTSNEVYYLTEGGEKILLAGSNITEPVLVDSVTIAEGEAAIATYKVTLRDRKKKKYESNASVPSTSSRPVATSEVTPTPQPAASEYFEEDGDGNVKLKDEYNGFWAAGFISAGGQSSSGGGGGGGISLLDVWRSLTNNPSLDPSAIGDNTTIAEAHIPTISIAKISNLSSWTGSQSITTLGTITTGVWNGSAIPVSKGGTGRTSFSEPYAVLVMSSDNGIGYVTNNTTTVKKFLTQTGNGAALATNVPVWGSVGLNDISGGIDYERGVVISTSGYGLTVIAPNTENGKLKYLAQMGYGSGTLPGVPVWSEIEIPAASGSVLGGIKTGYTTANNNYAVQLNASNQAYVYVPSSDTTYKLQVNGTWNGDSVSGVSLGSIYAPSGGGTAGNVLVSNGSSNAPVWADNITLTGEQSSSTHVALQIGSSTNNRNMRIYGEIRFNGDSAILNYTTAGGIAVNTNFKVGTATVPKDATVYGKLSVMGNGEVDGSLYIGGTTAYLNYVSGNSGLHCNVGFYSDSYISAGGVSSSSDKRLKTNIEDVDLTVAQIAQAPAVTFDWVDKTRGGSAGSIAQYWQDLLPRNVRRVGDYLTMEYGNMALISSIIVAREVETLRRRVAELEGRLGL